jgi:hypothetical protein
MLKRIEPLNPQVINIPLFAPTLKIAPKLRAKPRDPLVTIPDDGDIPAAVPKKP